MTRWMGIILSCLVAATSIGGEPLNPFMSEFETAHGIPPFDQIQESHYLPAFRAGIKANNADIKAIIDNKEEANFENTIEALENSGQLLSRVSSVFFNLMSSHSSDRLNQIAAEITPELTKLNDDLVLNAQLFSRVKAVYHQKESLKLAAEQEILLENAYKQFVRGGANLSEKDKSSLRALNEEISLLQLKFQENQLKDTNRWELVIDNKDDLAGIPDAIVASAAQTAEKKGHNNKWVFTLHRPSMTPFLQFAENRSLREKMFKGYANNANNDNDFDNKKVASRTAALRSQRAKLLGYQSHAHYVLEQNMAKTPAGVYALLDQVWPAAINKSKDEAAMMQAMIDQEGGTFKLQPWDWAYYAEKIRKTKYQFDEEQTRPYFSVTSTFDAALNVANKLFGITMKERSDLPVYHPDVKAFEVFDKDGSLLGVYFADYYVRDSKRSGAWMNSFRKQSFFNGQVKPIIVNCFNYPAPAAGEPTLLTFEQASTLFHEFGHALHGLLSNCHYNSLSGTAVNRDFVEFPSQVMENWLSEKEVLSKFAKHYKTGEPIPMELIDKLKAAGQFNQGFKTVEYLAASYLDMKWHSISDGQEQDTLAFEKKAMDDLGLIDEIIPRYRSTYFSHIFAGGYSAGYYSYIWAEILDADTFEVFKKNGIFDEATAKSFRDHILSRGGTAEPQTLYQSFRGQEPSIAPLLKRRGLDSPPQ